LIQPLFVDKITDAAHPQQIMVSVKAAVVSPGGPEQPVFFVQAKGARMNVQQLRSDAYGIQRSRSIGHPWLPFVPLASSNNGSSFSSNLAPAEKSLFSG
jgi:hypothetical protein